MKLRRQRSKFWAVCCSVTQSCLILCDLMDCSTPGFLVLHHLLELAQTHVHWVGDAIQPSHPLLSPSPPAFNLSHTWNLQIRVTDMREWHRERCPKPSCKLILSPWPRASCTDRTRLWSLLRGPPVVIHQWWCNADQCKQRNKAQPDKKTHQ